MSSVVDNDFVATDAASVVKAFKLFVSEDTESRLSKSRLTFLKVLNTELDGVFVAIFVPPEASIIT